MLFSIWWPFSTVILKQLKACMALHEEDDAIDGKKSYLVVRKHILEV